MSKHEKFILTPITSILEELVSATSCLGGGIETYPLWDYIIQSTFTKMTGFQEQKIKCIDWELATNGFEYRRSFIEEVKGRGTYSTYDSKKQVYNALISEIIRYSGVDKKTLIKQLEGTKIKPREIVQRYFENTNLVYFRQRDYREFLKCDKKFKSQFFIEPDENSKSVKLFESDLQSHYENELYYQRNRIAHNTLSYQQNLPELETLEKEDDLARNYFFWFSILVLIDEIFMEVYKEYSKCVKGNSYFEE